MEPVASLKAFREIGHRKKANQPIKLRSQSRNEGRKEGHKTSEASKGLVAETPESSDVA